MSNDGIIKFPIVKTLEYHKWLIDGYLNIVKNALAVVEDDSRCDPGKYWLMLAFKTEYPGVDAPKWVTGTQPILKIVINQQYFNLVVNDDSFAVTLHFGGTEARLVIPFKSIVFFSDKISGFTLSFEYPKDDKNEDEGFQGTIDEIKAEATETKDKKTDNIISLDAFRKTDKKDDE